MSIQLLDADQPIVHQLRFFIRVARLIPQLLASLESGHVESTMKLGKRRLSDGREVELWLVAKAPRRDRTPLVRGRSRE